MEEELNIRLTPVEHESIANVIAYSILARRVDLEEEPMPKEEGESSDSDWDE